MLEKRLRVTHAEGLHARPASIFVKEASEFQSDILVRNETAGRGPVNAKSILSVLTLGVEAGSEITLIISGPDEEEAMERLSHLILNGFGERGGYNGVESQS